MFILYTIYFTNTSTICVCVCFTLVWIFEMGSIVAQLATYKVQASIKLSTHPASAS